MRVTVFVCCFSWLLISQLPAVGKKEVSPKPPAAPSFKTLQKPEIIPFSGGIQLAVSTSSPSAQEHVIQGLNHLNGGWEFEASRHFHTAIQSDPDCLLAHWGLVMCLLNPTSETLASRSQSIKKLLDLVESGAGSELERGYAYGLFKYLEEGPQSAANAFRKVALRFPNDTQSHILAALFGRGGYNEFGELTPDQEASEHDLLELVHKNPSSSLALNALLLTRAEGPDLRSSLPLARKLCRITPDYPPYLHLLGHYEWRCGNHHEASAAFTLAATQYERWQITQHVSIADCPEKLRAETYKIIATVSRGDLKSAYKEAVNLTKTTFPANRNASKGASFFRWHITSLPARILLHQGLPISRLPTDSKPLPNPTELAATQRHTSIAYWWIDGLRLALETQLLIEKKDCAAANEVVNVLITHTQRMSKTQQLAIQYGERSDWSLAIRALEVTINDLRGRISLANPHPSQTAYNWFQSAIDKQQHSTMLLPPLVLMPMNTRLAKFHQIKHQPTEAIAAYEQSLVKFPNDFSTLCGLLETYQQTSQPTKVLETQKQIESLNAHWNESP